MIPFSEGRMAVVELAGFGGPDVLRRAERPLPEAGPGELRIAVRASGVNRPDVLQRAGLYPPPPGASDIPGLEVAGNILDGDVEAMRAAGLQIGDRVCALLTGGGYASVAVAAVGLCLPIPAGLSDIEAASLPETFFTVWSNVFQRGQLQAGETFLVQGGASGIGVAAIQLAKARGATVIATVGSDEKCAAVRALGADYAINYKTQDFVAEVAAITGGRGVDVILDMVAGPYIEREVASLAEDGRLVIIAVQGGVQSTFHAGQVLRKRLTITGSTLRPRSVAFKQGVARALISEVWPMFATGQIRPVIHRVFPALDASQPSGTGAGQAHALMESNAHIGKIVLGWGQA